VDKKEVIAVQLTNIKGHYVTLYNYGTIIQQFVVKNRKGEEQDIVLGFDRFEDYISPDYLAAYPYFGTIIGRYANRIKDGKFTLDGDIYQLSLNAEGNCLHGGINGFDKKVWDITEVDEQRAKVTFQYFSEDGEEGFPGDLVIQLSFEFTDHDELILTYEADTDEATPVNLTHHSYFNLSPQGGSIADHLHQINASHYLEQDNEWAVTGNLLPVEGTSHDFRTPKRFGENWDANEGYDQSYVLDKTYGDLTLASTTTEKESGLSLRIYTTEPVAHVYTAKYLNVKRGKGGKDYHPFEAFCVETQHHPNAINIPAFPDTVLRPEELYTQTTIYKVSVEK